MHYFSNCKKLFSQCYLYYIINDQSMNYFIMLINNSSVNIRDKEQTE